MDTLTEQTRRDTVLIVDDEEDILQSLQDLFEVAVEGLHCVTAPDGASGLDLLRSRSVDLIISDYKMPGMSGIQFLQEARGLAPRVPRVLMTAFPDLDIAIQAINDAGIDTFFTKPLDPERVIGAVRSLLEGRRAASHRDQAIARAMDEMRRRSGGAA